MSYSQCSNLIENGGFTQLQQSWNYSYNQNPASGGFPYWQDSLLIWVDNDGNLFGHDSILMQNTTPFNLTNGNAYTFNFEGITIPNSFTNTAVNFCWSLIDATSTNIVMELGGAGTGERDGPARGVCDQRALGPAGLEPCSHGAPGRLPPLAGHHRQRAAARLSRPGMAPAAGRVGPGGRIGDRTVPRTHGAPGWPSGVATVRGRPAGRERRLSHLLAAPRRGPIGNSAQAAPGCARRVHSVSLHGTGSRR